VELEEMERIASMRTVFFLVVVVVVVARDRLDQAVLEEREVPLAVAAAAAV
jgi:hypothetical protein